MNAELVSQFFFNFLPNFLVPNINWPPINGFSKNISGLGSIYSPLQAGSIFDYLASCVQKGELG